MAAPNLKNPTTITGKTETHAFAGTTLESVLGAVPADKVFKINSIFCSNVDGATAASVRVSIYNGTVHRYLAYDISVPADATQVISTKDTYFYLEEGSSIYALTSNADDLQLVIGYEEIS